jgi:hypothetical protein
MAWVTPCAPLSKTGARNGAHGVTRPTIPEPRAGSDAPCHPGLSEALFYLYVQI